MRKNSKRKYSIVYVAINPINKKKYVGVTSEYLSQRKHLHKWKANKKDSNCHFQNAIRKYGIDGLNWYTLSKWDNYCDALEEEKRVIALIDPEYNSTKGGQGHLGYRHTPEVRKKISEKMTGRYISPETRRKFSANRRKVVLCIDDGKTFESCVAAESFYKIHKSFIAEVCRGEKKSAHGLRFRYQENS